MRHTTAGRTEKGTKTMTSHRNQPNSARSTLQGAADLLGASFSAQKAPQRAQRATTSTNHTGAYIRAAGVGIALSLALCGFLAILAF